MHSVLKNWISFTWSLDNVFWLLLLLFIVIIINITVIETRIKNIGITILFLNDASDALHTIVNTIQTLMKNSMVVIYIKQKNKRKTIQVKNKMKKNINTFKREFSKIEHDNIPFLFLNMLLSTYIQPLKQFPLLAVPVFHVKNTFE